MLLTHRAGCERLPLNSLRCSPADTASSFALKIATRLLFLVSVFGPHTSLVVAQAQSSNRSANEQKINRPATGDAVEYGLTLRLLISSKRLEGEGAVRLPAQPQERRTLTMSLRNDMPNPRVEVLEPKAAAGIAQLTEAGADEELTATKRWIIKPRRAIPRNSPILLKVTYAGGSDGPERFPVDPDGTFGIGLGSAWYPLFDGKLAFGRVRYEVPKGNRVIAPGKLIRNFDRGDVSTFEFETKTPSYLAFVAGKYDIVHRREGRIPVSFYLLRERANTEQMLDIVSRAIEFLEDEFGKYPYDDIAVVEITTKAGMAAGFGGAAYPGFFLFRSDYLDLSDIDVSNMGHELSHEWFVYVVAPEGILSRVNTFMQSEGLAEYGGLRTVERLQGPAAGERRRRNNGETVGMLAAGIDFPLAAVPPDERALGYSLILNKGAFVYDMLSRKIGRDRFRAAMHAVTTKYAGRRISWKQFLDEIQKAAGEDLSWFYQQWFDRAGCPRLSLTWRQEGDKLHYTITQVSPTYRLDMPVQIEFADGSAQVQTTKVEQERTDVTVPVTQPVYGLKLDPHFEVLHATTEEWSAGEELRYYTRGALLWDSTKTPEALATFKEGLNHIPKVDSQGVAFLLHLEIGWIHQEAEKWDEAQAEYDLALAQAVRPPNRLPRLYLNIAQVAQKRGDHDRTVWAARNAISADKARGLEGDISRQARELLEERR